MSVLLALVLASPPSVQAFTSTAEVRACRPLADGRVLAATSGGLVLYGPDLKPERIWTSLDGLPGTDVRALAVSRDGSVWVGGATGVARLRRDAGQWSVEPVAAVRSVGALLETEDGRLLAGAGGGLVVIDASGRREPQRFDLPREQPRALVTSLAKGRDGVVLGTTGAGLWIWNGTELRPASVSLASPYVHTVAAASGRTLAATVGGLVELDGARPLSAAEVRALLRVEGGWLVGTMGEGLRRLDDATGVERPVAFPSRHVTALGRNGETTCAGTIEGTFVRRDAEGVWRRARVDGPPSNDVSALALDGERLWVGTFDRGLAFLERGRWTSVAGVDDRVNGLAVETEARGSRLWVATARGLAAVEGDLIHVWRRADGLPSDEVHAVAVLRGGGVVAGTARGAVIVRADRVETLEKDGGTAEATWAVSEGGDGSLWLGTTNGLYRHRRGAGVRRFSVAGGHLGDNWVTAIAPVGDSVWVGTYAGGVSRVSLASGAPPEPGTRTAHVNPAGLGVWQGRVWAATMEGVMQRSLEGGDSWRVSSTDAPGPDVTAMAHDRRWRWVASRHGLARRPGVK